MDAQNRMNITLGDHVDVKYKNSIFKSVSVMEIFDFIVFAILMVFYIVKLEDIMPGRSVKSVGNVIDPDDIDIRFK